MMRITVLVLSVLTIISCNAQNGSASHIDADKFEAGIINDKDVQILDVRTDGEFQSGHIKNAFLANWNDSPLFFDRVQYLNKKKPVYIYCLSGARSAAAAQWMRQNGYGNVIELTGGIIAWKKAGKPLETISTQKQMTFSEYKALIPDDKTVLVDVGATWCIPCKKMEPVIAELQKDNSLHFELVKVDAGVNTDVLKELKIDPIPVFIVYKNGKETWRKEGIASQEELAAQLQ